MRPEGAVRGPELRGARGPSTEDDAPLLQYVRAYLGQARAMTWAQLRGRQARPFATIDSGASGMAYAFLRSFRARGEVRDLDAARRWSALAWRARRREEACQSDDFVRARHSVVFGTAGIAFVEARVAAARGVAGRRVRAARLGAFLRSLRPRRGARTEFMQGLGGRLAATLTLLQDGEDRRLRAEGDRLAARLLDACCRPRVRTEFAHGAAGVQHALLRWSLATGFELGPRFFDALDSLITAPIRAAGVLARSWCNGAAGRALTFALAYENSGRRSYLDAARDNARRAAARLDGIGSLCCGLAGRAYAQLALERVDPGRGWRKRARELTTGAVEAMVMGPGSVHPNGLMRGHPGIVCLVLDLLGDRTPRFPIVED